jgi:hypothetical protein
VHIYEINTWTWLNSLSRKYNQPITLQNIPSSEIDALCSPKLNIDAIWLMGVWERSPLGRKIANEHPGLRDEFQRILPDFKPTDVAGSPYSVHRYVVDPKLGGDEGLLKSRQQLQNRGLKLILDFVPNHVALDHPWTEHYPNSFVQGTAEELNDDPDSFFQVASHIFARGRDPYFPAWTDTLQMNAFSDVYRQVSIETLQNIADKCDGIRCDMAMLLTNQVFSQTWSEARVGQPPPTDYWQAVIPPIRAKYADFFFIAEVYWDMEFELQKQGFDYCYDKRLYDRLIREDATSIHQHLIADVAYQKKLIRFIENHDEPRAMHELGDERSRISAVLVATLPGANLWHEGQFQGHIIKLPVQLGRRPTEPENPALFQFYRHLIQETNSDIYCEGEWKLRDPINAWPGNESFRNLIAYTWHYSNDRRLIVVNFSDFQSQGRIHLSDFGLEDHEWKLNDQLDDYQDYKRAGSRMSQDGLYIDLKPWQAHIFTFIQMED